MSSTIFIYHEGFTSEHVFLPISHVLNNYNFALHSKYMLSLNLDECNQTVNYFQIYSLKALSTKDHTIDVSV